jgi:hypothetical protein
LLEQPAKLLEFGGAQRAVQFAAWCSQQFTNLGEERFAVAGQLPDLPAAIAAAAFEL